MKRASLSLLVVCCLGLSACWWQGAGSIERHHFNAEVEKDIGYSQTVRVGNILYISGVVGWGPMPEAIGRAYGHLGDILRSQGLDYADVVKETVYTTDMDKLIENRSTRSAFYHDVLPASTWVGVQRLYSTDFPIEVEAIAVLTR